MDTKTPIQGFRLSPQQRRIWQLHPRETSWPYHAESWVEIEGELAACDIELALRKMVARHEILRSTFRRQTGAKFPMQVIGEIDLRLAERDVDGFDLDRGPQLAAGLERLDERGWRVHLAAPALCIDAAGWVAFWRELSVLLAAQLEGGEALLPDPLQYADLAAWQEEILAGENAAEVSELWRAEGDSEAFATGLPMIRRRGAPDELEPRFLPLPLADELREALSQLAARTGTSLSAVLVAAWISYAHRLSGQPGATVAACFQGRSYDGLEEAVGPLERFLPLTHTFDQTPLFGQVLAAVAAKLEQLYAWQEYFSWERIASPNTKSDDLFIPLAYRYDELPARWSQGALAFELCQSRSVSERFALCLCCSDRAGQLSAELGFDAQRLEEADVRRLGEGYAALLRSLHEAASIDALEILGEAERRQVVVELNPTSRGPVAPELGFLDFFTRRAAEQTDTVAVRCNGAELSYGELDRRSDRLARHLREMGGGADELVAIFLGRSVEMVVGLLAILKSGAAYLPLDPDYPRERLAHILDDGRPVRLLTRADLRDRLPKSAVPTLELDTEHDAIARHPAAPSAVVAHPESLAYVKYTSGSTGKPKGVMINHGNVGHCVQALAAHLPVVAGTIYLHTASFAFSSSTRHLLFPLSQGATVVVATGEQRTDPMALLRTLAEQRVAVLDTVPSMWRGCVPALDRLAPRDLRLGLSTGEALAAEVPAAWSQRLSPASQVFNLYGVTETATTITAHPVATTKTDVAAGAIVPIGRPIADTQVYLLDRRGRPVAIGSVAELHVGGGSPGRGYFRRPALTAERFVPNPFSGRAGDRLFRTGDLGSLLSDGTLEFHGRIDHQIQIRGFRVERGEIEAALAAHPTVDRCAVLVREQAAGAASLVAFFVAAPGKVPELPRLRAFLRETLPAYMVPNELIALDDLPLNPHGKVDYKTLAEPMRGHGTSEPYVPPRTPLEAQLAAIWAEALELERVGIHDDFIELGGHSMTAIMVVSKVRERLGVELPVVRLFEVHTVAQLAEKVESAQLSQAAPSEIEEALGELEALSDEEVERQLSQERV